MGETNPLHPLREMQAFLTRSLLSLVDRIQHTELQHQLTEQVRRVNRWVLRIAGQGQVPAPQSGFPRVDVPAWWRLLEEFEGAYDQWAETLPHNWGRLSLTELEAVARTMERTGWVLAWVPRDDVLRELIDSPDQRAANGRLLAHQEVVVDDLRKGLGEVTDPSLADLSVALLQGVRSHEWGHSFPAQAIAAVVLTALIKQQLDAGDGADSPLLTYRRNSLLRAGGTALNRLLAETRGSGSVLVPPLRDGAPLRPNALQPDECAGRPHARRQLPAACTRPRSNRRLRPLEDLADPDPRDAECQCVVTMGPGPALIRTAEIPGEGRNSMPSVPRVVAALVAAAGLTAGTGTALADPPGGQPPGGGHTPVTICHKPGTPAEHTLVVDDNAVPGHLGHGDSRGACVAPGAAPQAPTEVPSAAPAAAPVVAAPTVTG